MNDSLLSHARTLSPTLKEISSIARGLAGPKQGILPLVASAPRSQIRRTRATPLSADRTFVVQLGPPSPQGRIGLAVSSTSPAVTPRSSRRGGNSSALSPKRCWRRSSAPYRAQVGQPTRIHRERSDDALLSPALDSRMRCGVRAHDDACRRSVDLHDRRAELGRHYFTRRCGRRHRRFRIRRRRPAAHREVGAASAAEIWRYTPDRHAGIRLAVDAAGDVFASLIFAELPRDIRFLKLDGATGAVLWQVDYAGGNNPSGGDIAIDAAGDVFGGIVQDDPAPGVVNSVVKLSGATGTELWRYAAPGTPRLPAVGRSRRSYWQSTIHRILSCG